MAKKINEIKEKMADRLKEAFHNDCLTEYEERKALYYDANKLPRDQMNLMWYESRYSVANRPKWKLIYKLSAVFGL